MEKFQFQFLAGILILGFKVASCRGGLPLSRGSAVLSVPSFASEGS